MSQQLNFSATVCVLTLALFAVSTSMAEFAGVGSSSSASLTLAAPGQH